MAEPEQRDEADKETMKVFIVEDSAAIVDRLMTLLVELDHGVEVVGHAEDAPTAIAAIRRLKPDVVILDIRLTRGTGLDVLDQVKSDRRGPLVIMLTNYSEEQYRRKCLQAGADYFFDKSTEFDRVRDVFQKLIADSQAA
jgi:DNA-binding NarL/FixJ family response regulator